MKQTIVLGSASIGRQEILQSIGINDFIIHPADIDETRKRGEKPYFLSQRLAFEKNRKIREGVISKYGNNVKIITGDTVVAKGMQILEKAQNDDDVRKYMNILKGTNHVVYSSISVFDGKLSKEYTKTSQTRVKVKNLTKHEIEQLVSSKQGIAKAGGYEIGGLFSCFVIKIVGTASCVKGMDAYTLKCLL